MALLLCPPTFSFTLYPQRLMEHAFSLRPKLPSQGSCGHAALQCSLPRGHPLPLERCQITVAFENTAQQFLTESHNENDFIAKRKKIETSLILLWPTSWLEWKPGPPNRLNALNLTWFINFINNMVVYFSWKASI